MNLASAKIVANWTYARPLLACAFDPSGKYLFSTSEDMTLQRWNLKDDKPQVLKKHESWVHALAFTHDGQQLVSGGFDGQLIWWPLESSEPARIVQAHEGWIRSLVTLPDGRLASAGNDRMIRIWNAATGEKLAEWKGHEKHIYSLHACLDAQHLLAGDLGGKLHLWNLETKAIERSFDAAPLYSFNGGQQVDFGGVRSLALSRDGKTLAAGGVHKSSNPLGAVHEPLVLRFEWESGKLLKSHVAEKITGGVAWRCSFLNDGTLCSVSGGSSGGWLLFWNAEKDATVHQFQLPSLARDMAMHPDGRRIATVHHDKQVRITEFAEV